MQLILPRSNFRYTHRMAALIESEARRMAPFDLAAIPEYWIVDPPAQSVHVYTLANGGYQQIGTPEMARSQVLAGFELSVAELFTEAAKRA